MNQLIIGIPCSLLKIRAGIALLVRFAPVGRVFIGGGAIGVEGFIGFSTNALPKRNRLFNVANLPFGTQQLPFGTPVQVGIGDDIRLLVLRGGRLLI